MSKQIREIITPDNKDHWLDLRKQDVTSTEVAALFGLSPYMTEFELWHRKKDKSDVSFDPNTRMKWGTRLESAIAQGVAEDNNLDVRPMKEYMRIPELKMGSSFDYAIDPTGILEIKNVDSLAFKNGWEADGDDVQAPNHIELQAQYQLAVSGREFAMIAAFIGGNNVVLIRREPDDELIKQIKEKVYTFWRSVEKGVAPNPDFAKDADFIKQIYNIAKPGSIITADDKITMLAAQYKSASDTIKEAELLKDAAKAEMLTLLGDAEKCKGESFTISAGITEGGLVSYERKPFRNFRINYKKESK